MKLFGLLALLSISSLSFASFVPMPSAEILIERLKEFGNFAEKTSIVDKLVGKPLNRIAVATTIETAYWHYKKMQQVESPTPVQISKPRLYHAILLDSPGVLDQLKTEGLPYISE